MKTYNTLDEIHQDLQRGLLSWEEAKEAMRECAEFKVLAQAAGWMEGLSRG